MEGFGGSSEFAATGCTTRKERSNTPRRPRTDSHPIPNSHNILPNVQHIISACKKNWKDNGGFGDVNAFNRNGSENKLKTVKLKLGGVTHTIRTNSTEFHIDAPWLPKVQENIDNNRSCPLDMRKSLHKVPQKDFSRGGSGFGNEYSSRGKTNEAYNSELVRKSKRVPKRHVLDVGFSDDDEDEEIRYLGRLNASKVGTVCEDKEDESRKSRRIVNVLECGRRDNDPYVDDMAVYQSSKLGKYSTKRPKSEKAYEDDEYMEEEEPTSDDEPKVERKTLRKESVDLFRKGKKEIIPSSGTGKTLVDLPTGSLPAPRKNQKEKLSEVEQQLKKAEAAQRRRLQSEKAAREAEAEAIRKILGQDSARKKREEKMRKQRDEVAQGKIASSMTLARSTVRWVMGPTGTIVTFSEDIGLPSVFNSVPCSYPPPREKCVGPNCTNSYKYRDSKSKLPLCSLFCYRAIH
ncbi:hypothetical protein LOK49_LG06G03376 [Camellia lanceoleosa]|uniref:Uncharacterized protein n=1 Tax=Camellia lanceoleosa TaxID=1840588 RepID=A0ACC0HDH5_9ERIC|nr:hypothetical protein LOK49_LG06G03376 [Camellia lanceoleosa]